MEMLPIGEGDVYRAEISADQILGPWDFMYFIEAVDKAGNGGVFPDIELGTPYVIVNLDRMPIRASSN